MSLRKLLLRALPPLSHAPVVVFAIGVTAGTMLVLRRIDADVAVLGQLVDRGVR